jgi:uncharacterized protein
MWQQRPPDILHSSKESGMEINELTAEESSAFLERTSIGRLGCSFENQPYVVPIYFAYDNGYLYVFTTFGQKMKWMRVNPKVCVQADEIDGQSKWVSVIVNGEFEELSETQRPVERRRASSLLAQHYQWWLNALGERQMRVGDKSIDPLFFRIRIHSISGLRATDKK